MTPTTDQLRQAIRIAEQIEALQSELDALLGGEAAANGGRRGGRPAPTGFEASGAWVSSGKKSRKPKRMISPEAREKIAAAQRRRWAQQKDQANEAAAGE